MVVFDGEISQEESVLQLLIQDNIKEHPELGVEIGGVEPVSPVLDSEYRAVIEDCRTTKTAHEFVLKDNNMTNWVAAVRNALVRHLDDNQVYQYVILHFPHDEVSCKILVRSRHSIPDLIMGDTVIEEIRYKAHISHVKPVRSKAQKNKRGRSCSLLGW